MSEFDNPLRQVLTRSTIIRLGIERGVEAIRIECRDCVGLSVAVQRGDGPGYIQSEIGKTAYCIDQVADLLDKHHDEHGHLRYDIGIDLGPDVIEEIEVEVTVGET